MRDYRDAKTMAKGLRRSLAELGTELTHGESLELIAQAFGFDNWNILAARIEATRPARAAERQPDEETLYCGFCKKSQHDVKVLIAGPDTFICNECVAICDDVVEDAEVERHLKPPADGDGVAALEAYLANRPTEQIAAYLARAEESLAKMQGSLDALDGPEDAMPDDLRQTLNHGHDPAKIRSRLARHAGVRRKAAEVVARVLAARS